MSKLKQFSLYVNTDELNQELLSRPEDTTLLEDNNTCNDEYIFFDESKKEHRCRLLMINTLNQTIQKQPHLHCYWCHHTFPSYPIGCPIDWVNSKVKKTYYSHITTDTYEMTGELDSSKIEMMDPKLFKQINSSYYITDGIFCSFNCCLAYILDNNNELYKNSQQLLYKMLEDLNIQVNVIKPSPHWKTLKSYGGIYSIQDFRNQFNIITVTDMHNINIKTCCPIVKETLKF